jgi:PAS domain S-box-containing protein
VFGRCPEPLVVIDAVSEDTMEARIRYVNAAYCNATGFTSDEVVGQAANLVVSEVHILNRGLGFGTGSEPSNRKELHLKFHRKRDTTISISCSAWAIQDPEQGEDFIAIQARAPHAAVVQPQAIVQRLQSLFITHSNDKAVFEEVLSVLLSLSGSARGFLGEIHYRRDRPFIDPLATRGGLGTPRRCRSHSMRSTFP